MKKCDFKLETIDEKYQDYWFKLSGESQKQLFCKYWETSLVNVTRVLYSKRDKALGIERLFPFNSYVEIINDEELLIIIKECIEEYDNK